MSQGILLNMVTNVIKFSLLFKLVKKDFHHWVDAWHSGGVGATYAEASHTLHTHVPGPFAASLPFLTLYFFMSIYNWVKATSDTKTLTFSIVGKPANCIVSVSACTCTSKLSYGSNQANTLTSMGTFIPVYTLCKKKLDYWMMYIPLWDRCWHAPFHVGILPVGL